MPRYKKNKPPPKWRQRKDVALATPEAQAYQALLDAQKTLNDAITVADAAVRQETMSHFLSTGDKKPTPGAEVQMRKHLAYETNAVLDWLEVNAPKLVERKIAKQFDKVAEQLGAPVTVEYEPFVKVASNLRGYLPGDLLVATAAPIEEIED